MIISVILLTYNHEPYVAEAIESVLNQECNYAYELIIGEDCSSDGTREIVKSYALKHPKNIRLVLSPQQLRRNSKRNQLPEICFREIYCLSGRR